MKSVNFFTPLIAAIRKSVGMSHDISLAAWSAEIIDAGTQYTNEAYSIPLGESEESTSSNDTGIYP